MSRCLYCSGIVWPWQSQGFRIGTSRTWRWHGSCRAQAVPR